MRQILRSLRYLLDHLFCGASDVRARFEKVLNDHCASPDDDVGADSNGIFHCSADPDKYFAADGASTGNRCIGADVAMGADLHFVLDNRPRVHDRILADNRLGADMRKRADEHVSADRGESANRSERRKNRLERKRIV